jgi:hypothetical protein
MDSEEVRARDVLETNRTDKWWCMICCRPRGRNYCPASSHSPRKHNLIKRSQLSLEDQVRFFMTRDMRGDR